MQVTIRKCGRYPWYRGTVDGYEFEAEVYDIPSAYGINEGRISRLMVWDERKRLFCEDYFEAALMNYDRDWDIEPEDKDRKLIDELISYLEQLPAYNA